MWIIKNIVKVLFSFAAVIYALNFLADPSLWNFIKFVFMVLMTLHFIYSSFLPNNEIGGTTFAFLPTFAAYKKDGDYGSVSKYVWLTKVHYRYHDGIRKYHTDSLFSK